MDNTRPRTHARLPEPPTLPDYLAVMARIGLTSFGGGVSAWLMRICVQDRRWMTEQDFLAGYALCQVFPGINVVNLSVWLGYRFHGTPGAILGALTIIVPPAAVMILLAVGLTDVARNDYVRVALDGVAAAAIGNSASMGIRTSRTARRGGWGPTAVIAATFVAVGGLRLPLLPVLAVMAPLSIALAVRTPR